MTFSEFLIKRRIAETAFQADDPVRYVRWQELYAQMHPNSFYNSVKMVLNDVRRRYLLVPEPAVAGAQKEVEIAAPARPRVITRRAAPTKEAADQTSLETTPVNRPPAEIIAQLSKEETPVAEEPVVSAPASLDALEKAPPKPGRARPVFKRPASDAPAVEADAGGSDKDKSTGNSAETQDTPSPEAPVAKPSRPRPVFKRPASTPEITAVSAEPSTPLSAPENAFPVITPPAEESKPKPPRPRPVFKRPASGESEKPVNAESPVSGSFPKNGPETETGALETPAQEPAKTPRPRPIFKRPSSPAGEPEKPE
ncbi:hypothetical protein [Rufibacter soli]